MKHWIRPLVPDTSNRWEVREGDVIWRKHSLELILGIDTVEQVVTKDRSLIKPVVGLVELHVLRALEKVDVVVVGKCLELAAVGLAGAPDVANRISSIGCVLYTMDNIVLGLILKAAVMIQTSRA